MNKKQVVIVVPVIAPVIEGDELVSLRRCLNVFTARDICFLCSNVLDTSFYETLCREYGASFRKQTFAPECFEGVAAYNRLCFDARLYEAFAVYEYMLIYQLDAYVFEDRLDDWCSRGYDYVGGPWLCQWSDEVENIGHWEVGNGGFCLRRVNAFIKITTKRSLQHRPLKGYARLCRENRVRLKLNPLLRMWYVMRAITGYHNSLRYYIDRGGQEDKVFSQCQYNGLLRIPSGREALGFSFDMRPSTCYMLHGNRLPMGCHMWYKYDNEKFWYPIIYA